MPELTKEHLYGVISNALGYTKRVEDQGSAPEGFDDNQLGLYAIGDNGKRFTIIIIDEDAAEQ